MTAIALQHRDEIIAKVAQGAMLKAVSESLGITPAAISQNLAKDPEYLQAREIGAEVRLEEHFTALEGADNVLKLARAREGFRAATWFAEREFPERWGSKANVVHIQVNIGADQLLAGSAVAMLAEIVPATDAIPQCTIEKKDAE